MNKVIDLRTKKGKAILGIIITGAVSIIVAVINESDTWYIMWKERPIVDISFGQIEKYPKNKLESDANYYYVDILARNLGKNEGNVIIDITSVNATVNFDKEKESSSITKQLSYVVRYPEMTRLNPPIYIFPNNNAETFEIVLSYSSANSLDIHLLKPTELTYQKSGQDYVLIKSK